MTQDTFNIVTILLLAFVGSMLAVDLRRWVIPDRPTYWALFIADYTFMAVAAVQLVRLLVR